MRKQEIQEKLRAFIEESANITIAADDQPLDIDSFVMTLVITFVGQEMGVQLDMDQLDFDKFHTIEALADAVLESGRSQA